MKNILHKLLLMFVDFCLVITSYLLVILLIREDFTDFIRMPQVASSAMITGIGIVIALNAVDFYSSLWMYTSVREYTLGMLAGVGAVSLE